MPSSTRPFIPEPFIPEVDGRNWNTPLGKIVCIGRNYAAHAAELNNPVPSEPLLFIKPATAAVGLAKPLQLPKNQGAVHYELEIALLIGQPLSQVSPEKALEGIAAVGLALDLTLRDLQAQLKEKGHPWEIAKAWDASCPLTAFVPADRVTDWQDLELKLTLNGQEKQKGKSVQMLTSPAALVSYISQHFTLLPGDLVLTGTPAGVGPLTAGDALELQLTGLLEARAQIAD